MGALLNGLRRLSQHRYANLTVGMILFATGFSEAWEELVQDFVELDFGSHHGVMLMGIVKVIQVLPDLFEATEYLDRGSRTEET